MVFSLRSHKDISIQTGLTFNQVNFHLRNFFYKENVLVGTEVQLNKKITGLVFVTRNFLDEDVTT